jgi:hypothetical protein
MKREWKKSGIKRGLLAAMLAATFICLSTEVAESFPLDNAKLLVLESSQNKFELEVEKNIFSQSTIFMEIDDQFITANKSDGFVFGARTFFNTQRIGWFFGAGIHSADMAISKNSFLEMGIRQPLKKNMFLQFNYIINLMETDPKTNYIPTYKVFLGYNFEGGKK